MGKLAIWGAIEGLGKGLSRGAEIRYEEEKATTADRRGMRLEHFKQMQMNQRTKLTEGGATERHKESVAAQRDIATSNRELKETMAEALFTQQSTLLQEKYGFETQLEKLKQEGKFNLAQLSSITSTSQWEFGSYDQQSRHPKTGALTTKVVKTVSDRVSGITFDQHGDNMVANGMPLEVAQQRFPGYGRDPRTGEYLLDEGERKKAKDDADKWILAHPDQRSMFMNEFGYLPIAFFQEHGNLIQTKITERMRETAKLPRGQLAEAETPTAREPGEEVPEAPPEIVAALDKAGFGAGGAPAKVPGALERAAAVEAAPPGPPAGAPPAGVPPVSATPAAAAPEAPTAPVTGAVAPPGQPAAPPTPPPPITVGIQRGRTGEPGTVASFLEAAPEVIRGAAASVGEAAALAGGAVVEGIRKPQAAIAIAENAVKTGNIPRREDFEMLKRSWMMTRPYLTDEVIAALEPMLLKGGQGGGGSPAVTEG